MWAIRYDARPNTVGERDRERNALCPPVRNNILYEYIGHHQRRARDLGRKCIIDKACRLRYKIKTDNVFRTCWQRAPGRFELSISCVFTRRPTDRVTGPM